VPGLILSKIGLKRASIKRMQLLLK